MHPPNTYELRVDFVENAALAVKTKQRLIDWLLGNGVESFVEGELAVDINQNQDEPPRDHYTEMGGDLTAVSVYRYSRESLEDLKIKLEKEFQKRVNTGILTMQTETWMEGWKESFKPFATNEFWVRPPWIVEKAPHAGLTDLVIEPGMAFGTGQHATTRLCLEQIGLDSREFRAVLSTRRVLDVGTGTGILAIGCKKLGYGEIIGTDIEDDAILASVENARMNAVSIDFRLGSIPREGAPYIGSTGAPSAPSGYNLVLANILAVVLIRIMDDLAAVSRPGARLILSGLLVEEQDEVVERARKAGLLFVRAGQQDGWSSVVVAKPGR